MQRQFAQQMQNALGAIPQKSFELSPTRGQLARAQRLHAVLCSAIEAGQADTVERAAQKIIA